MGLVNGLGVRPDPILNHNFVVALLDSSSTLANVRSAALASIFDVAAGGFTECTGLEASLLVEDYREGGNNGTVLKFPTRVTWNNITLRKGIGLTSMLWDWHQSFVEGRGKRRDGVIALLNELRVPHNVWCFRRGLPFKFTGPAMNAMQNNIAIESIEIAHEGLYQVSTAVSAGGATSVVVGRTS